MNRGSPMFATTHWSVVLDAPGGDSPQARATLEQFCTAYWFPLYAYVHRPGAWPEDAPRPDSGVSGAAPGTAGPHAGLEAAAGREETDRPLQTGFLMAGLAATVAVTLCIWHVAKRALQESAQEHQPA